MAYVLPSINLSEFKEIIDIMDIIDIICIIIYGPKSNMPCLEYDILVQGVWHIHVPYHPVVLRAHQNHFCLLVRRGDWSFQINERETRTETLQTCQAEQRECHTSPTCQQLHRRNCSDHNHHHHQEQLPFQYVIKCNNWYNSYNTYNSVIIEKWWK